MTASYNHLKSRLAVRTYCDDVAAATTQRYIAWVPMSEHFMALCTLISGTGVLTFKIFAATDSTGSNPTVVLAHATPTTSTAAGHQLVLEVTAEQVLAALPAATHVSVEMDNDHADDINAVTYVRSGFRFGTADMTADVVA